jgi:hypothetical protein
VLFCVLVACLALPFVEVSAPDGYATATGLQVALDRPDITVIGEFVPDPSMPKKSIAVAAHDLHASGVVVLTLLLGGLLLSAGRAKVMRLGAVICLCLTLPVYGWLGLAYGARFGFGSALTNGYDFGPGFATPLAATVLFTAVTAAHVVLTELRDHAAHERRFQAVHIPDSR